MPAVPDSARRIIDLPAPQPANLMTDTNANDWHARDAVSLYNMPRWSAGYVDVADNGHLLVRPRRDERAIDLAEVISALQHQDLRLPVLLRFVDILQDRVACLAAAFDDAIAELEYAGSYQVIYPIKVNQQADVVQEIASQMPGRVGLEAGSKPELLAVLGLAAAGAPIICNGYKDREYVQIASIGARMGHAVTLVVEKPSELRHILRRDGGKKNPQAGEPAVGLRVRLSSIAAGNWQNTGGAKSKFGLTSQQVLAAVDELRAAGQLDRLHLLHLHLGSQVANLDDIRRGITEAARVYCDLRRLGVPIEVLDVGGGLGVDYEGTASRSFCSMNYSMQDYARCIVETLRDVCAECEQPVPGLMSESGRALTAHHAVLVANVLDSESQEAPATANESPAEPAPLLSRLEALASNSQIPPLEKYQQAGALMNEIGDAYAAGRLDLAQRAQAEQRFRLLSHEIRDALNPRRREHRELLDDLQEQLADKYFVNLSVFQSLPDVWALDQIFPIVPIQRLDEAPTVRASLCDLTCDSDGRLDRYVDEGGVESTLPVHRLADGESYCLGFFMVGAYQEILGDMHNLFGDTDAVNVVLNDKGWELRSAERGDLAEDLLRYVHCEPRLLDQCWARKLARSGASAEAQNQMLEQLNSSLRGYTYLLAGED